MIAPLQAGTLLIVGDSLSAGYGLADQKNWVGLLEQKLKSYPGNWKTVNISTSGDTTINGLAKLPDALEKYKPGIVVIELGANDGLRGLSIEEMSKNLETMINLSRQSGAKVVLLATKLPPNYGQQFLSRFDQAYQDLAKNISWSLSPCFWRVLPAIGNICKMIIFTRIKQHRARFLIMSGQ